MNGEWGIVVDANDNYAGSSLYGSIVQADPTRPGKFMGPAGWAGIRMAGVLTDGLTFRAPKNAKERKAVEQTRASSEAAARLGSGHLDAQYAARRLG